MNDDLVNNDSKAPVQVSSADSTKQPDILLLLEESVFQLFAELRAKDFPVTLDVRMCSWYNLI
jgi:hypothetical protein